MGFSKTDRTTVQCAASGSSIDGPSCRPNNRHDDAEGIADIRFAGQTRPTNDRRPPLPTRHSNHHAHPLG